jgi:hypothetical protein
MEIVVRKLTYANVVATLALLLALSGGVAYAAGRLGRNSVGTKQLKNSSVTTAKIRKGAVSASKLNLAGLGTVPSAARADTATRALSAASADVAVSAQSAADADALAGLTPAAFAKSSQIVSGAVKYVPASAQTILTLSGGFTVTTVPGAGGTEVGVVQGTGARWNVFAKGNGASHTGGSAQLSMGGQFLETFYLRNLDSRQEWMMICLRDNLDEESACTAISG